ncbi:MAG: hypothetical protein KDK90_28480 [Leptospiraceae bacterium]|nr:hypothetical protein [Leptospiraceae bacterium]
MIAQDLNIKEVDDKIIITIEKKQLNAEYILNLLSRLRIITKKSIDFNKNKSKQRIWHYSGCINLKNKFDKVNLRDYAYE